MAKRKAGRPTSNPKKESSHVRLDAECRYILDKYCAQYSVSKAEGIRQGIKKLKLDIKE